MRLSDEAKGLLLIATYILCVFLNYGYIKARREPDNHADNILSAIFWPVYWLGRGVVAVSDASVWLFTEEVKKVEK